MLSMLKNDRCIRSRDRFYGGGPFTVSSDGSFLACASGDAINIVDSLDSSVKSKIEGESDTYTALALSPNNKLLFSAGHSKQIRVWDLESCKCIRSWKGRDCFVMRMTCNASGVLLATAGDDGVVLVWDIDGGFCSSYFKGHKGIVTNILFHPNSDKKILFSASDDATIRVWNLMPKKRKINCITTLAKHFSAVTSIAVTEDGCTLLSAGRDKVVNLWNLQDYSCKATITTSEVLEAVTLVISGTPFASFVSYLDQKKKKKKKSSEGTYFVTVGERGVVRIWKSEGSVCLYEQTSSEDKDSKRRFTAATMLPLDRGLLCMTTDHQFLFYTVAEDVEEPHLALNKRLLGYNQEIVDMKFLGDEEKLLAVATTLEVRVYDLTTIECCYVLSEHKETIQAIDTCISSSGNALIVTGSKDNTARLWNSASKSCIGVGKGLSGNILAVAFGKKPHNFFVSGSSDGILKYWSLDGISEAPKEPSNLKIMKATVAHDKGINSVAVALNNSLVCTGSEDRTASIWRLPNLVHVATLEGHKGQIFSVEFSPVDQCVMTTSGDRTIKMWAISDGSCLKTFEAHTSILRASFITNGPQFVSCGADGLLKLWNVKTSECIATYNQHEDKVWTLAVGKKNEMIATGGLDVFIISRHDSTTSDKGDKFLKESDSDGSEENAIGANKRHKETNTVREKAREEIEKLNQQRQTKNEVHLPPTDYGDEGIIDRNWVTEWPNLLGVITDQDKERYVGQCWAFVFRAILQFVLNKDLPVQQWLNLDIIELIRHMNSKKSLGKKDDISITSMTKAIKFIKDIGLEKADGKQGNNVHTTRGKFKIINEANEDVIVDKLRNGPIGIFLDDEDAAFRNVEKGIYVMKKHPSKTTHIAMIIGCGTLPNGRFFFIMKNTWGLRWGDKGYGRIVILETCRILYLESLIK